MSEQPQVQVSMEINAPPEKIYGLVADLTRMGEWSPECTGARWKGGATSAVVGAKFKGKNAKGIRRWGTDCKIVSADPGKEIAWEVGVLGFPGGKWEYRFEPSGSATLVTEAWYDRRGKLLRVLGKPVTGVDDRDTFNKSSMEKTLEALKKTAESAP